jgi:hypothetical protein
MGNELCACRLIRPEFSACKRYVKGLVLRCGPSTAKDSRSNERIDERRLGLPRRLTRAPSRSLKNAATYVYACSIDMRLNTHTRKQDGNGRRGRRRQTAAFGQQRSSGRDEGGGSDMISVVRACGTSHVDLLSPPRWS